MPWVPELFSAPVLQRLEEKRQREFKTVPFFDGLMTGEIDALIGSFAGAPELHDPIRGRIRGARAFKVYVTETKRWISDRNASVQEVDQLVEGEERGCGEAVVRLDGETERVGLPIAVVGARRAPPAGRGRRLRSRRERSLAAARIYDDVSPPLGDR